MPEIDYSVIIRTIGKANEKYQKLLDSIAGLEPQPKEVIVVLPEGYALPEQQLGWETFYFSKKGMVAQRTYGLSVCKTKFAFFCDDDVNFGSDFIEKLHEPLAEGIGSLSVAPLYSFLPEKGVKTIVSAVTAGAIPTVFHKENYCTVLRGTGYSFNRNLKKEKKYYTTKSAAGTCFYANIDDLKKVQFEQETWIDKNGHASLEDQVMFYKAYLMGFKTIVVTNAYYVHADARTSIQNNQLKPRYCEAFNKAVFWHRFIYSNEKNGFGRFLARFCFGYKKMCSVLYGWFSVTVKKADKKGLELTKQGYKDAYRYIDSEEYGSLHKYLR